MSSDTWTPRNDRSPHRLPWRLILVILLLAAAGVDLYLTAPPAIRAYREEQRIADLITAGPAAEGVESLLLDTSDPQTLGDTLTPLFDSPDLASIRIWGSGSTLLCEVSHNDPRHPSTSSGAVRPQLGARKLDPDTRELIMLLTQAIGDQQSLSDRMDAAISAGKAAGVHTGLYVQQSDNLNLVKREVERCPALEEAAGDMEQTLKALTHQEPEALQRAMDNSTDAQTSLSLALENLRAVTDRIALPDSAAAPRPSGWLYRLLPQVQQRRVMVPLYVPTGEESLIRDAGLAEVIFYDYTADLVPVVARAGYLAGVFLLGIVLVFIPWRRKTRAGFVE